MFVISVLAFFSTKFNMHCSLEGHFLVIRIPWINKFIIIIIIIIIIMYSSVKTYICYMLKWHIRAPEA